MSTFAHMNTKLVFNQTLNVALPHTWNQLFQMGMRTRSDSSLPGIQREMYERVDAHARYHGEIWVIGAKQDNSSTPYQRVVSGCVQMYALSGLDSVQKNGEHIFIRPGEKVTFKAGDTFSFPQTRESTLVVLNENAQFVACNPPAPTERLRPPSNVEVEAIRAALGLHNNQSSHHQHRSHRADETSSRAYRGNRRPY